MLTLIVVTEKELREAAHAEIANTGSVAEFERPSKRKKSALIDDKAKQRYSLDCH